MPINESEIVWDSKPTPATKIKESEIKWDSSEKWHGVQSAINTMKNVGKVYPAFETAASFVTSTYGVPISGLVGLAALPFGADAANDAVSAVQKFLVYDPKTQGGKELTESATYPLQKLEGVASRAGEWGSEKYGPGVGTAIHTTISGAPVILGAKSLMERPQKTIPKKTKVVVEKGINKGVRPSIVKKEMWQQREKYMKNARVAVDEIITNKNNLKLVDREGNISTGMLPETLEQFSQAIEQTKKEIFTQYDGLTKQADVIGSAVSMEPIVLELKKFVSDKSLQTISPETVSYALERIKQLDGKKFTASETQNMVQWLNQTQKSFYSDPTPKMYGMSGVDSLIANNMRAGLDAAIESATGIEYAPLKRKYGALRMLETDVTKRAIVDARKNIKGLIDFSDMFSSHQLVYGVFSGQFPSVAAGATVKGMSSYYKYINNPNRIVKKMFQKTEKLNAKKTTGIPKRVYVQTGSGSIMAQIDSEE